MEKKEEIRVITMNADKRFIVSQDNALIQKISTEPDITKNLSEQSFILNTWQKRLILLMISHIKPTDTDFPTEEISFYDLCDIVGIKPSGANYKHIENGIRALMGAGFRIEREPGVFSYYHWLSSGLELDFNQNKIRLKLDAGLKSFLLGLKKNFTAYEIGYTLQFKKKYTFRLYEYLKSIRKGFITIGIEKFIHQIVDDTYTKITDLERYVLKPALQEINETSDITVSYSKNKSKPDRRSKTISFNFWVRNKTQEEKREIMLLWGLDDELLQQGEYDNKTYEVQEYEGHIETDEEGELPF